MAKIISPALIKKFNKNTYIKLNNFVNLMAKISERVRELQRYSDDFDCKFIKNNKMASNILLEVRSNRLIKEDRKSTLPTLQIVSY
jgi:hypothetical protein